MTDIKPLDYLRAIRDARDLTSSERLVAVMVMSHAGPTGRKSHPGIPLLMFETGLSDKTIRRALKSLEAKKWLVLTYSGHGGDQAKANEYDLNIPVADSMHSDPSGNGDRLGDSPTGNPAAPTGTGDRPDALDSDALRDAHHQPSADGDDAETPPPGETQDHNDGYSPATTVAGISKHFPGWDIQPSLLTGQIKRVASDMAVPAEVVCQAVEWWVISAVLGQTGWGLPRRLDKVPDRNPAGWLYNMMPGLASAYIKVSAKKAAELGVDPARFDYCDWLTDQNGN